MTHSHKLAVTVIRITADICIANSFYCVYVIEERDSSDTDELSASTSKLLVSKLQFVIYVILITRKHSSSSNLFQPRKMSKVVISRFFHGHASIYAAVLKNPRHALPGVIHHSLSSTCYAQFVYRISITYLYSVSILKQIPNVRKGVT